MKKTYSPPMLQETRFEEYDVITYSAGTLETNEFENDSQWWTTQNFTN